MVFPEVVVHPNTPGGFMGVDYSKLTAVLTQGIKELYVSVQEIKTKLNDVLAWFNNGNLNIQKDVCVDDVCVTKDQFKQMLRNGGASVTPAPSPVPSAPAPVVPDTETPTSTPSVTSDPVVSSTTPTSEETPSAPVSEAPSTPEPVLVTPAPEPAPTPVVVVPAPEVAPAPTE
jgi:hypothetical protein